MWCGVVWCGVVWCGVVWRGVVWCGVVWCGVVWCGVVWCGVVWRSVGANLSATDQCPAERKCDGEDVEGVRLRSILLKSFGVRLVYEVHRER